MTDIVECSNCKRNTEYTRTIIVQDNLVCYKCTLEAYGQLDRKLKRIMRSTKIKLDFISERGGNRYASR